MLETLPKECSECGTLCPTTQQQGNFIDYGWTFNYLALGYYGGFTDCVPDGSDDWDDEKYIVHLCHNCCLKLIRALPGVFQEALGSMGCHPGNVKEPSCCEYAWTTDTSGFSYRGDGEGGWILYRLD
jgi:hypothetical protein